MYKSKKSVISFVLVLLLALCCFAACGNSGSNQSGSSSGNSNSNNNNNGGTTSTPSYEYVFRDLPEPVYHEAAEAFAGGDGTELNPYQISTAEELALLSELLSEFQTGTKYYKSYYVLTADINLNDTSVENWYQGENVYSWIPIGRGNEFAGVLDGNGYTISGLYINTNFDASLNQYDNEFGLFGTLQGTVKNLNISNAYIAVSGNDARVGTIAGTTVFKPKIEGCKVEAIIECYDGKYGGIVGSATYTSDSYCTIQNCEFRGSITQKREGSVNVIGGIAGTYGGDAINCTNYATISYNTTNIDCAGGIAGRADSGKISNCKNEGALVCTMSEDVGFVRAGGIAGLVHVSSIGGKEDMSPGVTIIDCQNNASVEAGYRAGGIAGEVNNDESPYGIFLENCVNNGHVYAKDIMGGVIGSMNCRGKDTNTYNLSIKKCVNNVDLEGRLPGGIIGSFTPREGKIRIDGCENNGNVTGQELYAGGIVTYMMILYEPELRLEILQCENTGAISSPKNAGGIVCLAGTTITYEDVNKSTIRVYGCKNSGEISTSGIGFTGGVFGCYGMANIPTEISNCTNAGTLTLSKQGPDAETEDAEDQFTLARCTGGIIGRVGYGIYLSTDSDKGAAENVQKKNATYKILNCHNKGRLNVATTHELYTDYFGGILGNVAAEKEFSFFVEDCTYMYFDRGLGHTEFQDVGEKIK